MSPVTVRPLTDPGDVLEARRLHGRRYLEAGFVDHLDDGGVIDDMFVEVSDYFGAFDAAGRLLGVYRMIPAARTELPIMRDFELHDEGASLLTSLLPDQVAEMSALAVERSTWTQSGDVARALYRAFFQHALVVDRYTHIAAALDSRVARANARRYGSTFLPVGAPRFYMGSETLPMVLDLYAQLRSYTDGVAPDSAYFLEGLVIDLRSDGLVVVEREETIRTAS